MKNYFANFVKETSETNNVPIKSKEQITNKYYLNANFLRYDKRREKAVYKLNTFFFLVSNIKKVYMFKKNIY